MSSDFKKDLKKRLLVKVKQTTDKKDIEAAAKILEETFKAAMENDGFEFSHYTDFAQGLREQLENEGKLFIVKYGLKSVATISMLIRRDFDRWFYTGDVLVLCHLGVLPEYQDLGLGRMLVDVIKEEATKLDMPIILSTPEKNINAVKFYERNGFSKVNFAMINGHYSLRLCNWNTKKGIEPEECRARYENMVMYSMLKDWQTCAEQTDPKLQELWNEKYYNYLKDIDSEKQEEMVVSLRRYGINPEEFMVYGFDSKTKAQRSRYISENTVKKLNEKYYNSDLLRNYDRFCQKDAVASPVMKTFESQSTATVNAITFNNSGNAKLLYSWLKLRRKTESGKSNHFSLIDKETGIASSKVFRAGTGKKAMENRRSKFSLDNTELPEWDSLVKLVENTAKSCADAIIIWELTYTDKGWVILKTLKNVSFANPQLALGKGVRKQLEEMIGESVNLRLKLRQKPEEESELADEDADTEILDDNSEGYSE